MKRILSLIMAIIFVFSLSACKNKNNVDDKDANTVTENESVDNNGATDSDFQDSEDSTSGDEFSDYDENSDYTIDFGEDTEIDWDDDMSASDSEDFQENISSTPPTSSDSTSSGTEHTHNWQAATCQAPQTCSICKATKGDKAEHKYSGGKCTYCGASESDAEEEKAENEIYSDYINYRGYNESLSDNKYSGALANTYQKIKTKKELNVVYFGGSVTYGYGSEDSDQKGSWRGRVGEWLTTTFPKAKINNINRAIGDTGTTLGLLRLKKDVLSKKPDLLFIEFSINDYYEGLSYRTSSTQFESIIRTVKEALPECDIVTILVTDRNEAPLAQTTVNASGDPKAGTLHTQANAHEYISRKYNISSIHVGRALVDEIVAAGNGTFSTDVWSEYVKDGVHPKNKGYDIYFKVIKEFLSNALLSGEAENCEIVKQQLPEKVNLQLADGAVTFLDDSNKNVSFTKNNGTIYTPNAEGLATGWAEGGDKGVVSFKKGSTDTITVKFTGTELFMVVKSGLSTANMFEFSIDGGKTWTKGNYSSKNPATVFKCSESKEYTVIIRPALNSDVSIDCFYSRNSK